MSATKSASREMPTVNTTSSSEALTPDANHAKPTAVMSGPVRLPGRRHQATRPAPVNDQPTRSPSAAVLPRSSTCPLPRTSAAYASPPASAAPASAASASRSDGSGLAPSMPALWRRHRRGLWQPRRSVLDATAAVPHAASQ